jgi:hypothetical protein
LQACTYPFAALQNANSMFRECTLAQKNIEEGILYADDLSPIQVDVITRYVRASRSEVVSSDYDERIHVYNRSEFVERLFFDAIRTKSLIVAFNAPWDISRLALSHRVSRNRGWTLILSQRISRKTGQLEPNPERPCMRVTSKDSKAAFFSLTKPVRPEEWPTYNVGNKTRIVCRVLDLHTFRMVIVQRTILAEKHVQRAPYAKALMLAGVLMLAFVLSKLEPETFLCVRNPLNGGLR